MTPDGKAASVFDLIAVATEDTNPRRAWKDLCQRFPELVLYTYNYKFSGQGQRETPVTDKEGTIKILMGLPGQKAAQFRDGAAKIVKKAKGRRQEAFMEQYGEGFNPSPIACHLHQRLWWGTQDQQLPSGRQNADGNWHKSKHKSPLPSVFCLSC